MQGGGNISSYDFSDSSSISISQFGTTTYNSTDDGAMLIYFNLTYNNNGHITVTKNSTETLLSGTSQKAYYLFIPIKNGDNIVINTESNNGGWYKIKES